VKNKKFTFFKIINAVILVFISVIGLVSFLSTHQEIKAEAAVKSGNLVEVDTLGKFPEGVSGCGERSVKYEIVPDVGVSYTYLCTSGGSGNLYYQVDNCTTEGCVDGTNKYTDCGDIGIAFLCRTETPTSAKPGDTTNSKSGTTLTDQKAGITCDITVTDFKIVNEKKINLNYTLGDCTKDGAKLPNASFSCIAWVVAGDEKADDVQFGCAGGDEAKALTFDEGGALVWDSDQCYAFFTASGSTCIKEGEISSACGGTGFGVSSFNRTLFGLTVGAFPCAKKDFATFKAANPILSDIVSGPDGITGNGGGTLSDDCKGARDAAIADKKKEFTCNNGQKYTIDDKGQVVAPDGVTKYDSSGNKIQTSTSDGKTTVDKAVDATADLGKFIWQIAAGIFATLLFYINGIVFAVLYFFGAIVLFFLSINPAAGSAFDVASKPWGILVGVANAIILASFMYVGFGYLLGVESLKKNLGEFIQKIIYYAILLNFTLSGAATLVNIGYGMGNLIKVSYAGTTNGQELNYALSGNLLNSIGKVSLIRCGNQGVKDCVVYDNKTGKPDFFKSNNLGGIFGKPESAGEAAIREGISLVMAGFAIYVFWRVLKIVVFRFVGIWMIMILSPLGLASYFSPVESLQSLGKEMWDKFIKFVLFYPAFIFALILVNLLSGTFSSKYTAIDSKVVGAGTSATESLLNSTSVILGAVVSMTALYYVTKYFADSFDADMGKVGEAVGKGWEGTKKGLGGTFNVAKKGLGGTFNVAKKGLYGAGIAGRLGNKGIKSLAYATGNKDAYDKTADNFRKNATLRTVGNLLTGRTLYDLEQKAVSAKRVWTGISNTAKKDIERNKGEQDVYNSASLRGTLGKYIPGMTGILDNVGDDPLRGVAPDSLTTKLVDELAQEVGGNKANAVVEGTSNLPGPVILANLQGMLAKGSVDNDRLKEIYQQALKTDDAETLQILQNEPMFREAVKTMYDDVDTEIKNKISDNYGNFLPNDTKLKLNTESKARNKDYRPSNVEAMDEKFSQQYIKSLEELSKRGSQVAREKLASFKQQKASLGDAVKRADQKLHGVKDGEVKEALVNGNAEAYTKAAKQVKTNLKNPDKTKSEKFSKDTDRIMSMKEGEFEKFVDEHGLRDAHDELGLKDQKDFATRKAILKQTIEGSKQANKILESDKIKNLEKESEALESHANGTATNNDYKELALATDGLKAELEQDFEKVAMEEYEKNTAALQSDIDRIIKNTNKEYEEAKEEAIKNKRERVQTSSKKIKEHLRVASTATGADKDKAKENAKREASKHLDRSRGPGVGYDVVEKNIDHVADGTSVGWDSNLATNGQNYANNQQANSPNRVQEIKNQIGDAVKDAAISENQIDPDDINF
jgi:hypothetical protein